MSSNEGRASVTPRQSRNLKNNEDDSNCNEGPVADLKKGRERAGVALRRRRNTNENCAEQVGLGCEERPTITIEEASVDSSSSSSDDSPEDEVSLPSFVTNVLFFVGSAVYVWLAVCDLKKEEASSDEDDDDADDDDGTDDDNPWDTYRVLNAVAASTYVISATVEFFGTCVARESTNAENFIGDMSVAVTFGFAAICELFAVFLQDDDHPEPQYAADTFSVHFYLINAMLALSSQRLSFETMPLALVGAGDILFLLGSIIDAALSYFCSPETADEMWRTIAWWNLASAILWLTDSILYLIADFLLFRRQSRELESYQVPLLLTFAELDSESVPHEE